MRSTAPARAPSRHCCRRCRSCTSLSRGCDMSCRVRSTCSRPRPEGGDLAKPIAWGPSPRASQALMLAVRARALLDGRLAPSIDDVLDLAEPILKHRMALTFSARAEGRTIPDVIRQLKTRIG